MQINLDEGYQFGLGVFETIAVERQTPLLLEEHLRRLGRSIEFMGFRWNVDKDIRGRMAEYLEVHPMEHGVLKIMVSGENVLFTSRNNPYHEERYKKGFIMDYSQVRRNETSPLVYHKTMNYGDCILEKRKAAEKGLDELVFLNTRGEICEGTSTNIFFVKDGKLYTPKLSCGMLPGVMREYICRTEQVEECVICPSDVAVFEECFVTNSLMGVMPVIRLGEKIFTERHIADQLFIGIVKKKSE